MHWLGLPSVPPPKSASKPLEQEAGFLQFVAPAQSGRSFGAVGDSAPGFVQFLFGGTKELGGAGRISVSEPLPGRRGEAKTIDVQLIGGVALLLHRATFGSRACAGKLAKDASLLRVCRVAHRLLRAEHAGGALPGVAISLATASPERRRQQQRADPARHSVVLGGGPI